MDDTTDHNLTGEALYQCRVCHRSFKKEYMVNLGLDQAMNPFTVCVGCNYKLNERKEHNIEEVKIK